MRTTKRIASDTWKIILYEITHKVITEIYFSKSLNTQLFSRIREPHYGSSIFIVSGVENDVTSPPPILWKWKIIDDSSTFALLLYFVALWTLRCLIESTLGMHLHRFGNGKGDATLISVGNSFGTSMTHKCVIWVIFYEVYQFMLLVSCTYIRLHHKRSYI